jgi:hypothetical protein
MKDDIKIGKREHAAARQLAREIGLKGKIRFVPAGRCRDTGNWIQAWWQHWQIIPKHGRQRYHTARFHIFQRNKIGIACWYTDHRFTSKQELTPDWAGEILKNYERLPLELVQIGHTHHFVAAKELRSQL